MSTKRTLGRMAMGMSVMWMGCMATPASAELKKSVAVEGITEYQLENGLRVLLFPDSSKPTVTVNVTYLVGSRHEGRGEAGMAHLLEHMVFKGTPNHPDIWKSLEDHGANFNGTTWLDRTNYFETLPTSVEGNLEWALAMEADRMVNSHISQEDLSSEFSVVRNEFEIGESNPMRVLMQRLASAAFEWHNYGKSTIGNRSDIERVPASTLKKFYEKYYQPDNAVLVVAGDFKPEQALSLVEKYFGAIPKPDRILDDTYTVEPEQDGARLVELRRNGDVAACGAVYHISAATHPDFAAIDVLNEVLTDQPSGRLYKALVESGMASSVSSFAFGTKEPGLLYALAEVSAGDSVPPVLDKMTSIMESLAGAEITDDEVNRAKRKLAKNIEMSLKDSGRVGVALSNWIAVGDWRTFFLHRDRVESVTVEHVRKVASHYLKASNRTAGIFYPTKDIDRTTVPETPDVVALVKDYKGKAALSEGEEFEATYENIERRVTRTALGNGMKLALLPKETRGDAVQMVMHFDLADEASIRGRQAAIDMIPSMLMRGSKNHSYQQIRDRLDELKATVNLSAGGGRMSVDGTGMSVRIRTDRENLGKVIELVGEMVKEPTFPTDEFEVVKKEELAGLEEQLSDPRALAFRFLSRALSPWATDDVRYEPTIEESVERVRNVSVDDLRQFHGDFYGANNGRVTVVGDFDADEIKNVLAKTFGKWTSKMPYKRVATPHRGDIKPVEEVIHTPDKAMATVVCGLNAELRDDDPEAPALELANYVLGASAKSRLMNRLRQKEGLSYGTGSFLMTDNQDRRAFFGGMALCAPQNANKAYNSMIDEITTFVETGLSAGELADAKDSFIKQVKTRLANDGMVAGMINGNMETDRTLEFDAKRLATIENLTPSQVNSALKKHLVPGRLVKVKAGDLKKAESTD